MGPCHEKMLVDPCHMISRCTVQSFRSLPLISRRTPLAENIIVDSPTVDNGYRQEAIHEGAKKDVGHPKLINQLLHWTEYSVAA